MRHSPFASAKGAFNHLLGLRPSGRRAEGNDRDEKESKRAEDDDEKEKAEDDDDDPKAEDDDEKEKAEEDDDDANAEADDDKEKEAKKAKDGKGKTYATGRADERKRCAAIFASEHAAGLPHVAAQLAFTTDLSARQAIGVMAGVAVTGQPQGKRGLGERMANVPSPAVGPDGGSAPEKGSVAETVARMTSAYNRVTDGAAKK